MPKEHDISPLSVLQPVNNISIILLLHTFNIISLILSTRKCNYVMCAPLK